MRALELLIEDYERRLKTTTESIQKNRSNGSIVHQRREERLNTKASEYRTFIAELRRAMAVDTSASTCNLQNVSGSLPANNTTKIIKEQYEFEGLIDIVECCKIGPITDENYCPNCGKKILRQ